MEKIKVGGVVIGVFFLKISEITNDMFSYLSYPESSVLTNVYSG